MRSFTFGVREHDGGGLEILLENHQQPDDGTLAERMILSLAIQRLMAVADAAGEGARMATKKHYEQPSKEVMAEVRKFFERT